MGTLFEAVVGARVHAFLTEFGLVLCAGLCVVGGLALLAYPIPFLARIQRTLACVLFGAAVGLACWFGGYRARGALDASAGLRDRIAALEEIGAERDRREAVFRSASAFAAQRADQLAREKSALEAKIRTFDDASHSRDTQPCLDAWGLRRLDAIR